MTKVLSNSMIKGWRRCPKQYEFKYVMGLKPKKRETPLYRGDWLHQLLMTHYDGEDWMERHRILTAEFNELFEEEQEELGNLPEECHRIFRSYLAHWKHEDKKLTIIDSEVDEVVDLPNGDEFNFIVDLIVQEPDGGIWLWDHKTVKDFMPESFMLLDTQLARYFWAAQKVGYKPLRGILFNELRTAPPTLPKLLKSGKLEQRRNIRCDVYSYLRAIKEAGQDPKDYAEFLNYLKTKSGEWYRRTRLAKDPVLTKQTMRELMMSSREIKEAERLGHFPRTPMKSCQWDCGFIDPCTIQLHGGSIDEVIRLKYERKEGRSG